MAAQIGRPCSRVHRRKIDRWFGVRQRVLYALNDSMMRVCTIRRTMTVWQEFPGLARHSQLTASSHTSAMATARSGRTLQRPDARGLSSCQRRNLLPESAKSCASWRRSHSSTSAIAGYPCTWSGSAGLYSVTSCSPRLYPPRRHPDDETISLSFTLLTIAFLLSTASIPSVRGAQQFDEAEIFFELNHTDGDLGIHASIDGEPWTDLEIEGPGDSALLNMVSRGRLARQGMTQLFFESAEPDFEELRPSDFFSRFPEGRYHIDARAQEGGRIQGSAMLSHVLAAPPANIRLNNVAAARSCDDPLPMVVPPVLIDWDPVTQSHPDLGKKGPVNVSLYQLFVEREGVKFSLDLPAPVTQFEVPRGVTDLGKDFKFEIIARTATGNNTAIESCFLVP